MCCVVIVVVAISCVPLELQTLQIGGCPRPFSKGKAPSTGDQDSGSSSHKQGLYVLNFIQVSYLVADRHICFTCVVCMM